MGPVGVPPIAKVAAEGHVPVTREVESEASPYGAAIGKSPAGLIVRFAENKLGLVGVALFVGVVLFAFVGPLLYHTDQIHTNFDQVDLPPGAAGHLLGTDQSGYDVLGRLMAGGQTSLIVSVAAAFLAAVGGSLVGAAAGFSASVVDSVLMRLVDAFMSIPQLFVVIVVATIVVPSRASLMIIIASMSWFTTARLVRGEALRIRELEYVEAARSVGSGRPRIVIRHVLPNAVGVIVVSTTFQVADAILILASLDFLGLGIPSPSASWGGMLSTGLQYIYDGYWWLIFPAGGIIMVAVMAVNFIGDGLRDAVETRLRER
jgi:peptide/nickel transport system permease protein